jgi:hypothetical protein
MALSGLTPRQETAARLTRELQSLGATVTNAMPLDAAQPALRFWVDDYKKKELLQELADKGYEPTFLKMEPQMCIRTYSVGLVNVFELAIPAECQEVPQQDRVIPKDDVGHRETNREVELMLTAIYGKQRK